MRTMKNPGKLEKIDLIGMYVMLRRLLNYTKQEFGKLTFKEYIEIKNELDIQYGNSKKSINDVETTDESNDAALTELGL